MAKRVESPSSINTFKQCPRKYYYQYIGKLPTTPSIHTVRGNIAHSTLENFYNIDVSVFLPADYKQKFKESVQRLFLHYWNHYKPQLKDLKLNADQERFYFEETMLMLLNWTNHFLLDLEQVIQERKVSLQEAFMLLTPIREQEFKSEKLSVRGFIDAIHHIGEEVHIVDYKTNSTSEIKDSILLQLGIYCLLYEEMYGKQPDKVGIFFLRNKLKLFNVEPSLLEVARKEIEFIHSQTAKGENMEFYPKQMGPLCKWSSGQCDFYTTCKPHEKTEG